MKDVRRFVQIVPAFALALALFACEGSNVSTVGRPCDTREDCNDGELCVNNRCVAEGGGEDGGIPTDPDGGTVSDGGSPEIPAYDAGIPERPEANSFGKDNTIFYVIIGVFGVAIVILAVIATICISRSPITNLVIIQIF